MKFRTTRGSRHRCVVKRSRRARINTRRHYQISFFSARKPGLLVSGLGAKRMLLSPSVKFIPFQLLNRRLTSLWSCFLKLFFAVYQSVRTIKLIIVEEYNKNVRSSHSRSVRADSSFSKLSVTRISIVL